MASGLRKFRRLNRIKKYTNDSIKVRVNDWVEINRANAWNSELDRRAAEFFIHTVNDSGVNVERPYGVLVVRECFGDEEVLLRLTRQPADFKLLKVVPKAETLE